MAPFACSALCRNMKWRLSTASVATPRSLLRTPSVSGMSSARSMNRFDPGVDIVLVLTTGPQHEEAVRAAIAAGKTVYCEWPLTPDSKTSAELVDLAAKAGVQTILATQRRFAPGLRYLKD